jgi:DNA-binding CsgD family transcriptional regulator
MLLTIMQTGDDSAAGELANSNAIIMPANQGCLRYADAMRLGRNGRCADATAAAAAGDELLRGFPWYLHAVHRLVAEEAIQHGWGDPVGWLRPATEYFHHAGQARLASACASLLRKAGASLPHGGARYANVPAVFRARGVTARELEVLAALKEGLSNREIGARLYLSPKTVEKHVASLMNKLDVRTRAQLAAIAASGTVPT